MGLDRRKRSGRIFAGSQLNVEGQGIYSVKIIAPNFSNKTRKPNLEDVVIVTTTTTVAPPPVITCNVETQQFNNVITQGYDNLVWC